MLKLLKFIFYKIKGYVGNYLQVSRSNVLYQKDMKFGGTPLHWSLSRQVIEALVDMNCHIDSVNFELRTPLHMMVIRNRLDCTVALLSRQANPNLGDCNGDRPIHLAVKEGNLSIIQCLIIFGADLDVLNNAGESPRHLLTNGKAWHFFMYSNYIVFLFRSRTKALVLFTCCWCQTLSGGYDWMY